MSAGASASTNVKATPVPVPPPIPVIDDPFIADAAADAVLHEESKIDDKDLKMGDIKMDDLF